MASASRTRDLQPAVLVVLLLGAPASGFAQFGLIEKALGSVESLGIYYLYGGFHPRSTALTTGPRGEPANQTGLDGFGFEMAISVGSIAGKPPACKLKAAPKVAVDTLERYTVRKTVDGKETKTDYLKVREKVPATQPPPAEKCDDPPEEASFQVALGYSHLSGFAAQDSSFDLRGAIRELPSIAFYMTYKPENAISQYFGIRAGIVQFHSLRGYDSTTASNGVVYTGGGSTFQLGIAGGLVADIGNVNFFVEPSYNIRKINSIEWTPVANLVPTRFPRELNFSGWQIALGVEFSIKQQP